MRVEEKLACPTTTSCRASVVSMNVDRAQSRDTSRHSRENEPKEAGERFSRRGSQPGRFTVGGEDAGTGRGRGEPPMHTLLLSFERRNLRVNSRTRTRALEWLGQAN